MLPILTTVNELLSHPVDHPRPEPPPPACKVSAEKYANYLIRITLYVVSLLSFAAFKILSLIFESLIIMFQWSSLWNGSVWKSLCFVYLNGHLSFSRFGKFSAIISLNKVSCPFCSSPSGIPTTHILFHAMVSHYSHRLSSLFFILMPFFSSV